MAKGVTRERMAEISKATQFASDRQPENRKKPDSITALIKQELAGDGWAVFEEAELLGEGGKPTGQKASVRIKITTADAIAKKILQRAMKSSDKLMTEIWERIDGKVPQDFKVGGLGGGEVQINVSTLSTDEKRKMLEMLRKAKTQQGDE